MRRKLFEELVGSIKESGKIHRGKMRPARKFTYGSGEDGDGGYLGIAVDAAGSAHVTGSTRSADFPTAGTPLQPALADDEDAFVTKLGPTPSLVYSTYLGGSEGEQAYGIAVDGAGNAYVTGMTISTDFPTAGTPFQAAKAGGWDTFVTKLSPTSGLLYSTYLGGSSSDLANAISADVVGNIIVTGETASGDFPTAGSPFQPVAPADGGVAFVTGFHTDSTSPPAPGVTTFYTLTPCRLIDTRKGAYHRQCIGCHERQFTSAFTPTECASCHHPWIPDHSALVTLTGKPTPQDVTRNCLSCHPKVGQDVLKTVHWNWKGYSPTLKGYEHRIDIGLSLMVNNSCIAIGPNLQECASCHFGYGWVDEKFDFANPTNIDCLVCHDTSGTYRKDLGAGGLPNPALDLVAIAK